MATNTPEKMVSQKLKQFVVSSIFMHIQRKLYFNLECLWKLSLGYKFY